MLEPIKHILSTKRIILASGSPRRKLILENVGLRFEVVPSTFEENLKKESFRHPYEYVMETGKRKAMEVAQRLQRSERRPDLVIGADTVVTMDNKIFEKPQNKEHAFQMLSGFSGRTHTVYTGVTMVTHSGADNNPFQLTQFYETTDVMFATLDPETIKDYIETGEPMDKAGGYGIQAAGGTLIESIHGDYFNVMGFPLHKFSKELVRLCKTNSL